MYAQAMIKEDEKEDHRKHLFIIDGYGFVFRAYHSMPPLTRDDGTPVGAVYGFTNMIMKLKSRLEPDNGHHMLVALDSGRKTFRNDIYSEYKANRPPAPEDLVPQFPLIHEAVEALGLPACAIKGYEADDIIATYVRLAKEKGMRVTIVSSDKDLMQLIDDDVEMYDAMKDKRIGIEEVVEKFGVKPNKVLDILALMGDSSDNIPGVPGIGPKTAAELVNTYGGLDETLARAGEVKQNKRRESLIEFKEQAELSRELARLCEEVPVEADVESFALVEEDPEKLLSFLSEQGFKSLVTRISNKHGVEAPVAPSGKDKKPIVAKKVEKDYQLVTSVGELEEFLSDIKQKAKLAIYPIRDKKDNLLGVALAKSFGEAVYIPTNHVKQQEQGSLDLGLDEKGSNLVGDQMSISNLKTCLDKHLSDPAIIKIGYDVKKAEHLLGFIFEPVEDVLVMSYILDGAKHKHDLANIAQLNLGTEPNSKEIEAVNAQSEPEQVKDMLCQSASLTVQLHDNFRQRLFDEKMLTIYETIERPLVNILAEMEEDGVRVDVTILNDLSKEFAIDIAKLEKEIFSLAGEEFNVGSPKQLGEVLFEHMGIEGGKKSKKSGAYTTGADILDELSANGHTIADKVLKWRELSKLKSTYTDALVKEVNDKTGRIHTTFAMAVASTGRLSSSNPNLQNIPIRTAEGRKIRTSFIAAKGNKLISADYSQIELRLLAHIAEIDTLKEAFRNNQDIHATTASQVFGMAIEEVDDDARRAAKTINFGIIYGQSAFGLARQLGIGRKQAADYIEAYFTQYPGIRKYMEVAKEDARANGYITTLYGRKCFFPGINDKNGAIRAFAERAAINAPLQGTAADIIKKAMIAIDKVLKEKKLKTKMILQIHDELIFDSPEDENEEVLKLVKITMENVVSLDIPTTVDAAIGSHWGEAH